MFTFGYSQTLPHVTYRLISKDGFMHDPVPITISDPVMMHDFAVTENNAIFIDLPLYFRPKGMMKYKKLVYTFDATKKAWFGILPGYAQNELLIKWFQTSTVLSLQSPTTFHMFHGDSVVVFGGDYDT